MKPLWLVGEHIDHSRSPAMHNAALEAMSLPAVYALRPVGAAALAATLDEAERTCAGFNVTAPHKVAVAERYASVLDDTARMVGAVNTVVVREGRAVSARNTDVAGLLHAWRRAALHVEGRTLAVLGAGGAARAAVVAAAEAGARGVVVHARRRDGANALLALAAGLGLDAVAADEPCGATFCIVAVPVVEDPEQLLRRTLGGPGAVHDLRYGPMSHPLRDAALRAGHLVADGTLLLFSQGILALESFLGTAIPEQAALAMRRAAAGR